MPLKKLEKGSFVYLVYHRKTPDDFLAFRKELVSCATADGKKRDIVLDLTNEETIGDGELLLLANIVRGFAGTRRKLWILGSKPVQRKLDAHHLFKTGNAAGFENRDELLKGLESYLKPADQTPGGPA
jgi:hypothetical protein